jgi:hypothetical protein
MTSFSTSLLAQHGHKMNTLVHNAHKVTTLAKGVRRCLSAEFKKRGEPQQRLS